MLDANMSDNRVGLETLQARDRQQKFNTLADSGAQLESQSSALIATQNLVTPLYQATQEPEMI